MCPRDYAVWMRDVNANEYNVQEKISIILARNGWMEHIWHLLFKLHLDATSKKSWGG